MTNFIGLCTECGSKYYDEDKFINPSHNQRYYECPECGMGNDFQPIIPELEEEL